MSASNYCVRKAGIVACATAFGLVIPVQAMKLKPRVMPFDSGRSCSVDAKKREAQIIQWCRANMASYGRRKKPHSGPEFYTDILDYCGHTETDLPPGTYTYADTETWRRFKVELDLANEKAEPAKSDASISSSVTNEDMSKLNKAYEKQKKAEYDADKEENDRLKQDRQKYKYENPVTMAQMGKQLSDKALWRAIFFSKQFILFILFVVAVAIGYFTLKPAEDSSS